MANISFYGSHNAAYVVEEGGKIEIPIPSSYNSILYLLDGEGDVLTIAKNEFTFGGSRTYRNTTVQATVKMTPVP